MGAVDLLFDVKLESERLHQLALGTLLVRTHLLASLGVNVPLHEDRNFEWEPCGGIFDLAVPLRGQGRVWVEIKVDSDLTDDQLERQDQHVERSGSGRHDHVLYLLLGMSQLVHGPEALQRTLREDWRQAGWDEQRVRVAGGRELIERLCRLDIVPDRPGREARDVRDLATAYCDALLRLERRGACFQELPIADWTWEYPAFFAALRGRAREREEVFGLNYVNNPGGGFWGCWWAFHPAVEAGIEAVYLQFEDSELCFKIQVDTPERRSELRNLASEVVLRHAAEFGLEVARPTRFGTGQYMTVARLTPSPIANGLEWDRLLDHVTRARRLVARAATELSRRGP